jgi:NADPH2:quinone reductase
MTMKAIGIWNFGGREQLQLIEVPKPAAAPDEVLIRIRGVGVNPVDVKIREGLVKTRIPHQFPVILGWDAAGVAEDVGEQCRRIKPGDEVFAYCRKPIVQWGTYTEYVAVPESSVALKPRGLSFEEAASIPLSGLTAYQSLFDVADVKAGQTVLIHAAAGGVGGFGVQLARSRGARVIATASAANHDYVRGLGADGVVDYTKGDFRDAVRLLVPAGVDVAFDTVGGDVQTRSADVVKPGGILVSLLAYPDEAALKAKGIRTAYHFVVPSSAQLDAMAELAQRGKFRTHLAAVLPLEQAARAHELIEARHTRGKIVLRAM